MFGPLTNSKVKGLSKRMVPMNMANFELSKRTRFELQAWNVVANQLQTNSSLNDSIDLN